MTTQGNVSRRKLSVLVTSVAETSPSIKAAGRIIAMACVLSTLAGCWSTSAEQPTAEQQVAAVAKKLQELNPGFDGKVTPTTQNGVVRGLGFNTDNVTDISPVRVLVGLANLSCSGSHGSVSFGSGSNASVMPGTLKLDSSGKLVDLSSLNGMPLTNLECGYTNVSDLSPLKGMPLTWLDCHQTPVSDLSPLMGMPLADLRCGTTLVSDFSPLRGMPLRSLDCGTTQVSDLSPLKGMPLTALDCGTTNVTDLTSLKGMSLTSLNCEGTRVSDLSPLKGMPLTSLDCGGTLVSDLSPLKGMPLTALDCGTTNVSDLTPLKGMSLTVFIFTPKNVTKGIDIIRRMKSVTQITIRLDPSTIAIPPAEFWKKYDAAEFWKKFDAGDFNK